MTVSEATKERTKLRLDNFQRRLASNQEVTKYTLTGIGALVLVVINFSGTLISAQGAFQPNESLFLVTSAWAAAVCIMFGFVRLYFQGRLSGEVYKLEVSMLIDDREGIEQFRSFIERKFDRFLTNASFVGMLIFAGISILTAVWAFYQVLM